MKAIILIIIIIFIVIFGGLYFSNSKPSAEIANPASVNCTQNLGGQLQVVEGPEGQIGYCKLPDGKVCEEWALFRDQKCVEQGKI